METRSYFPVRVCVLGVKCRAGLGSRWLFYGGTIGNGVKSGKFGASKVLLALNKRKKKFSLGPRVGTIVPKSVLGQ